MAITQFLNFASNNIGISATTVVPAVPSGTQYLITGFSISNTTALPVTTSAILTRAGYDIYIVANATVNPGGSLVVAGWDQKIGMMTGDSIKVVSSASVSLDAVVSLLSSTSNPGAVVPSPIIGRASIAARPFVSGGLLTLDFQGDNNATVSGITSGSLSQTATLNLYSSNITTVHGPQAGYTSLRINGANANPNYSARAEVTGLNISPGPFTLEGWFYYEVFDITGTSVPVQFSIGNSITENLAIRWVNNGTKVEFNYGGGGVQGDNTAAYTIPTAGVWQHHAITADGATYRYYLDGVLITQTTSNPVSYGYGTYGYGQTAGRTVSIFAVGNYVTGQYSGLWSKLWVWNCRYSTSVVYTAPFTPVKTGMY